MCLFLFLKNVSRLSDVFCKQELLFVNRATSIQNNRILH